MLLRSRWGVNGELLGHSVDSATEPVPEGARFTRSVEMRPRGLGALMAPAMAFMVPRRNRVFVRNLKTVLER